MADFKLKDLKDLTDGLEDAADAFDKVSGRSGDASKSVEIFERRIRDLLAKSDPTVRFLKDIGEQLSRQTDLMRQAVKAADDLARAYDRLSKAAPTGKRPYGPQPTAASTSAPSPKNEVSEEPKTRSNKSAVGGLTKKETEALSGSTVEAISALASGEEPLKVMLGLGKDVAKMFHEASLEGVGFGTELKRLGVSTGVIKIVAKEAGAARAGFSMLAAGAGEAAAATAAIGEGAVAGAAELALLTPFGAVLAGVAVAAVGIGAAFAVTAQQIGKSVGENLDHLHLTEEQLARVKDKGVTMGDVLMGVWKTVSDAMTAAFGPALESIGQWFGKLYQDAVDGVVSFVRSSFQAVGAFVGGMKAAFTALPPAIADLVFSAVNLAAEGLEKLANGAIDIVNNLIRMANQAAAKFGVPIQLPELDTVSIGRLENKYAGAAANLGKAMAKGAADGAAAGGAAFDGLAKSFIANVVEARDERVVKEAGKATEIAKSACDCPTSVKNVTSNTTNVSRRGGDATEKVGSFGRAEPSVRDAREIELPESLQAYKPEDPGQLNKIPVVEKLTPELDTLIEKFEAIGKLSTDMGAQLEAAFGKPGKALATLTTSVAAYGASMADIKRQLEKGDITEAQATEKRVETTIKSYGAMAGAAKGFFKENSEGYKAMQVAEIAFHTIETLNTIKSMALHGAETASAVSGEAAKQAAFSATAYAKTLSSLPFPFNLLAGAAVLAALVQVGAAMKGKPSGGSVPGANDMKTRQDAQGAGSVLGDSKGKSESLEKALTHAQAYENKDLEYGNAMVRSLKSIDDQIGAVAAALARSFGAGGMLSAEGLNLGKSGTAASLSNLGFGKTTTRTLQDQGIEFNAASLADIVAGGLSGSTYQQVLETTKKKAFGITTSSKSKVITETGSLDADFLDQVGKLIGSLGKGVADAAKALGATDVEGLLASFKVDLGKLSFKDMTGTQIEEALNAVFGKLGDDMAKAAVPAIAQFQKVGEGAFETLVRVARQYEVIDTTLRSVGMTFATVGIASLEARERLVELVGGLDTLTDQAAFFAEHFLSEDERLKPVKDAVANKLAELQLPTDLTREGFRDLVLKQDVSTEDGAKMYAALMALAPAFDKVATAAENAKAAVEDKAKSLQDQIDDLVLSPADKLAKSRQREMEAVKKLDASLAPFLETLWKAQDAAEAAKLATDRSNMYADLLAAQGRTEEAKALKRSLALAAIEDPVQKQYQQQIWAAEDAAAKVAEARNVLTEAYNRERDAIQATKDKFAELSKSLRGFSASLSATIAGSDLAGRYRSTRQAFLATAAMARLGDPDAMGRLQAEGEAFTAASRDYVSTSQDYLRDVGLVRSAVDEAADTADRQASIAEQQLDALNKSVEGLIQINTSVVSVRDAIAGLQGALAQQAAVAAMPMPAPVAPKPQTSSNWANPGKTLDGKYHYDAFLGNLAATTASHDPQYYPGGVNPALTPGTYEYSILETFKERDPNGYYEIRNSLGFATGGSFDVGGSGPPDSKLFSLALTPGEAVNVRRAGDNSDQPLVTELRRLREELADLRATSARIATSNDKMERTLTNVTEGGRAMQTQAAA